MTPTDKLKKVLRNNFDTLSITDRILFAEALAALTGEPIITAIQKKEKELPVEKTLYGKLVKYFTPEYPEDDIHFMLMKSKFSWEIPNSILLIEYDNGNVEKIKITDKVVQMGYKHRGSTEFKTSNND